MKRLMFVLTMVLIFWSMSLLTPLLAASYVVPVDLGPAGYITNGPNPNNSSLKLSFAFNNFSGMSITGQKLVLDILFTEDKYITFRSSDLMLGLNFNTNAGGYPGLVGSDALAFLIDKNGDYFGSGVVGRAMGSNGTTLAGFFPGMLPNGGPTGELEIPYDFYGVHYELSLPEKPDFVITFTEFNVYHNSDMWALIVNPVPEPQTMLLLIVGILSLIGIKKTCS